MASGELDNLSAKPVAGDSRCPLRPETTVIAADNGSTTHRWEFRQRTRLRVATYRLWAKTTDGRLRRRFVTVGVHEFLSKCAIGPQNARVCVPLQPRIDSGIHHLRVAGELIGEAPADVWSVRTQIHQMAHWSTRSDQWDGEAAQRVPHKNYIAAPLKRGTDHVGVVVEGRRGVIDRQVHRNDVMSSMLKMRRHPMPAPSVVPRTVNQRKSRHAQSVETMPSSMDERALGRVA